MVKTIEAVMTEGKCDVDVDMLHRTLLELPAEKYLHLYFLMREQIKNGDIIRISTIESRLA